MLAENPINYWLFQYGYLGRENIYEFWIEHRERFLQFIEKRCPDILLNPDVLEAFEMKVRWKSPLGMNFQDAIHMVIRTSRPGETVPLENISIRYGKRIYGLRGYLELHRQDASDGQFLDLRGICLLKVIGCGVTLDGIDFTYACLDGAYLEHIDFCDCNFKNMTMRDVILKNCRLSGMVMWDGVDVSDSYFDLKSESPLGKTRLSRIEWYHASDLLIRADEKWLPYTITTESSKDLAFMYEQDESEFRRQWSIIESAQAIKRNEGIGQVLVTSKLMHDIIKYTQD